MRSSSSGADEKTGALTDSGKRIEIGTPRLREALYPVTDEKHSPRKGRRKGGGVTMADVAAAAGVSMQTVSRALRFPTP